jgi:hypothetical protein
MLGHHGESGVARPSIHWRHRVRPCHRLGLHHWVTPRGHRCCGSHHLQITLTLWGLCYNNAHRVFKQCWLNEGVVQDALLKLHCHKTRPFTIVAGRPEHVACYSSSKGLQKWRIEQYILRHARYHTCQRAILCSFIWCLVLSYTVAYYFLVNAWAHMQAQEKICQILWAYLRCKQIERDAPLAVNLLQRRMCRVGQNHTFIGIYGVHTVLLAGK